MELLVYDHEKHIAVVHPTLRTIEEFNKIIRRDRGSKGDAQGRIKLKACKELAYVYHMVRHDSPYVAYDEELRSKKIIEDVFKDEPDWKPDKVVNDAIAKYEELYETPMVRLLKSSLGAIEKMSQYFDDIDFSKTDKKGGLLYAPKDVITAMSKLGDMVKTVGDLKKQVEQELSGAGEVRGGVKLNKYNS